MDAVMGRIGHVLYQLSTADLLEMSTLLPRSCQAALVQAAFFPQCFQNFSSLSNLRVSNDGLSDSIRTMCLPPTLLVFTFVNSLLIDSHHSTQGII